MTQFSRPVRQAALLESPELQLRYPDETDASVGSGSDEGVGNGFDGGSPRAYAERWFKTADDPHAVQLWFGEQLTALGWQGGSESGLFSRDPDERVGVVTFGALVRIHFEVEGSWPDGSTEYRPL